MELKNFSFDFSKDSKITITLNLDEQKELISKYIVKRKKRIDDWM